MGAGLRVAGAVAIAAGCAVAGCGFDGTGLGPGGDDASDDGSALDVAVDTGGDGSRDGGGVSLEHASLVAAGVRATSPGYTAIVTLGQGPGGNAVTHSPGFTFVGGLVGATQETR